MSDDSASLKVSPHVLVQLGSELVTDVEQALLECVKNSYDADSIGCRIDIQTRESGVISETGTAGRFLNFTEPTDAVQVAIFDAEGKRLDGHPAANTKVDPETSVERQLHYTGKLTIEDNGDGISPGKIASSWLVISGSAKRADGTGPKKTTVKGRTPLGDKGLGRLGTMKLGDILEVESATGADKPLAVARFRWQDCHSAATVDQVPVFTEFRDNVARFKGTRVNVFGLHDLPDWRRKGRVQELARSFAKLVSPFETTSTFPVSVTLDNHEQSLGSVTDQVLSQAIAKFSFDWGLDAEKKPQLVARAQFMTRLFTTARSRAQREKADLAFNSDGGVGFRTFLDSFSQTKGYEKLQPKSAGSYIEFVRRFPWTDMMLDTGLAIEDPGKFSGAFYFFHLDVRDAPGDEAATGLAVTREIIKDMAGISILRDGFRVRSQGDWLNLSTGMTSGSIYNMRVNNTIGYFALTGAANYRLVEKSDREGFVENAAYRGFFSIATKCRQFANDSLEAVRRGLDAYYKQLNEARRSLPATDPAQVVEESLAASERAQAAARRASDAFTSELEQLEARVAAGAATGSETARQALNIARKAATAVAAAQASLPQRASLQAAFEQIKVEREAAQEQLLALYESAAVGLSARGLAHELRTHIGDIRQRMTALTRASKNGAVDEQVLSGHVRAMRDSCSAILSAASLIDPMLPRSRMLKETFDVSDFIAEYLEHRRHELLREGVNVLVTPQSAPLVVRMNKSRLLQVVDNLVRNSMYWLHRGHLTKTVARPKEISIEIGNGTLSVADSGPGVDPHYEDSLFEIFVSGKPKDSDGQGLGLFIVKQLLAADGCDIQLSGDRNPEGHRYRFTVDLGTVRT